jgi:hypothetical protein
METDLLLNDDENGEFNPSTISLVDLLLTVDSTTEGLTVKQLKKKKATRGNAMASMPRPTEMPEWMCCLLPCLDATHEILEYKRCIAQTALVKRAGRDWMTMEVSGLLVGDLIKVEAGEIVPADARVVSSQGLCVLDTTDVCGGGTYTVNEDEAGRENYEYSPNLAFAGYKCDSGEFTAIVVATGSRTMIGKLIKRHMWPLMRNNKDHVRI